MWRNPYAPSQQSAAAVCMDARRQFDCGTVGVRRDFVRHRGAPQENERGDTAVESVLVRTVLHAGVCGSAVCVWGAVIEIYLPSFFSIPRFTSSHGIMRALPERTSAMRRQISLCQAFAASR